MENQGSKEIWILIQRAENCKDASVLPVTYELLGEGKRLAEQTKERLCAVVCQKTEHTLADELFSYGADRVYFLNNEEPENYQTELWTDALEFLVKKYNPNIFLAGGTDTGHDLMARLAARLHTGLTVDCTEFKIDTKDGRLCQIRPAFGGALMASIKTLQSEIQMCTVRPGMLKRAEKQEKRTGEIIEENLIVSEENLRTKVVEKKIKTVQTQNISDARIVIGGGMGIGGREGFALLESLAKELQAGVGGTRAAANAGWITHEQMIGQTGKIIAPDLYIACGISGAVQHMSGVQHAKCVIAINNHEDAPIFRCVDYGIVGDYKEILPLLIRKIRENRAAE